jgi:glyoxylase-like metal-dependent hydrolase (beta-lactamase superfamily II)
VTLDVNLLVVESDGLRILFDAGAGSASQLRSTIFGDVVGSAPDALRAAGIDPCTIDLIALSHAHPDHAWGLIDSDAQPCFPNAKLAIGNTELEYWLSPQPQDRADAAIRNGARCSLSAYRERIIPLPDGGAVTSAVTAREVPGHSPGHLVYEIADGADRLVCWGDICHHPILLADPSLSFVFDYDPAAASRARIDLLSALAEDEADVLAYHLPFPGIGRVKRSRREGYTWHPRPLSGLAEDRNHRPGAHAHSDSAR